MSFVKRSVIFQWVFVEILTVATIARRFSAEKSSVEIYIYIYLYQFRSIIQRAYC